MTNVRCVALKVIDTESARVSGWSCSSRTQFLVANCGVSVVETRASRFDPVTSSLNVPCQEESTCSQRTSLPTQADFPFQAGKWLTWCLPGLVGSLPSSRLNDTVPCPGRESSVHDWLRTWVPRAREGSSSGGLCLIPDQLTWLPAACSALHVPPTLATKPRRRGPHRRNRFVRLRFLSSHRAGLSAADDLRIIVDNSLAVDSGDRRRHQPRGPGEPATDVDRRGAVGSLSPSRTGGRRHRFHAGNPDG
jgi:hypothetical protein